MRYAIIKDGQVVNIVVSNGALSTDWVEVDHTVNVTDLFDGENFTKMVIPEIVAGVIVEEVP